jgi:hypothetical protein
VRTVGIHGEGWLGFEVLFWEVFRINLSFEVRTVGIHGEGWLGFEVLFWEVFRDKLLVWSENRGYSFKARIGLTWKLVVSRLFLWYSSNMGIYISNSHLFTCPFT